MFPAPAIIVPRKVVINGRPPLAPKRTMVVPELPKQKVINPKLSQSTLLPQHVVYNMAMEALSLPNCLAEFEIDCFCDKCARKK